MEKLITRKEAAEILGISIFRVERNKGYTVMSNHHLRNKELSLKAKGLLSQMLSLPEDWDYLLCRCAHNPYARIAHTVKERVELPPLRVLLRRRFQKELVYGYIVAEHKLKEYLQTWVLPLVLNVRKVARRDKHFVAYFLAALLAPCPRRLYRCPKSLEVVFRYWSFCHSYSPYYILQFPFLSGYVYTVPIIS